MEVTWPSVFFILLSLSLLTRNPFIILLCLSLLILSVLSFSRTTWAAILIGGIAFLVFSARKKKYLAIPVIMGIVILIGRSLFKAASLAIHQQLSESILPAFDALPIG